MLLRVLQGNHALSTSTRIALLTWSRGMATSKPIEYRPIKKLMIANRGKIVDGNSSQSNSTHFHFQ